MPITFGSKSQTNGDNWGSSESVSHTVGAGANRLLVVCFAGEWTNGYMPTAVTYNGDSLTRAVFQGTGDRSEIWYLVNPDVGTHNVTMSFDSSTGSNQSGAIMVSSYFGVDVENPVADTDKLFQQSSGTRTLTLSCPVEGCLLVDSFASTSAGASISVGGGQVLLYDLEGIAGGKTDAGSSYKIATTSGNNNMSWSNTGSDSEYTAVAFNPFIPIDSGSSPMFFSSGAVTIG